VTKSSDFLARSEGGEERLDLFLDVGGVVERQKNLFSHQLTKPEAEPVSCGASRLLRHTQFGGEPSIEPRFRVAGESRPQNRELASQLLEEQRVSPDRLAALLRPGSG
jgi:hypothetical protein